MINQLKKYALSASVVISGLLVAGFASADSYITLPGSATADLFAVASQIFSDVWPLVLLAIAIPTAFYVIKKIVGIMPKR
jgi:hypothetical protein